MLRYIERNPVRAGMVASPSAYRWSSFKANTGEADDRALCGHAEYTALGFDAAAWRAAYRRFCLTAEEQSFVVALREATNAGLPLVGSAMRSRLKASGCRVARGKPGPPGDKGCGRTPVTAVLQL
jgi:putative transposase